VKSADGHADCGRHRGDRGSARCRPCGVRNAHPMTEARELRECRRSPAATITRPASTRTGPSRSGDHNSVTRPELISRRSHEMSPTIARVRSIAHRIEIAECGVPADAIDDIRRTRRPFRVLVELLRSVTRGIRRRLRHQSIGAGKERSPLVPECRTCRRLEAMEYWAQFACGQAWISLRGPIRRNRGCCPNSAHPLCDGGNPPEHASALG